MTEKRNDTKKSNSKAKERILASLPVRCTQTGGLPQDFTDWERKIKLFILIRSNPSNLEAEDMSNKDEKDPLFDFLSTLIFLAVQGHLST